MGLRGRRVGGDFDPVGEPDTLNELGQLVVAIEPAPAFLSSIDQLEHHRAVRHTDAIRMSLFRPLREIRFGEMRGRRAKAPRIWGYG